MQSVEERFLRYAKVHTTSKQGSAVVPSTEIQFDLAKLLMEELIEMGVQDVTLDDHCFVMGKIPSNSTKKIPAVGFLAHVDTSPECSGEDVKPQIIEKYDGGDIVLNEAEGIVLSPSFSPSLNQYVGKRLITTDGTTLLGADDKAGIAEIMVALDYILHHPEIEHGDICVGFTPDEEVGLGVKLMDVAAFGADFAYTLDGERIGELQYETFNAAQMKLDITGRLVHPSNGKGKMINASKVLFEFDAGLPGFETPEFTAGYEGFYHLTEMSGNVEFATATYIIRDHDAEIFAKKKEYACQIVAELQRQRPTADIKLDIQDTYFNMKEKIMPVFGIVEIAKMAMKEAGIEPIIEPFRGGTDGAMLSYMGLPCPNIFAGWHNAHGRFEYVAVEAMEKATEVIINIIKKTGESPELTGLEVK